MRTERYELRDDSCAAGKWRGGIGMVRVNRFLDDTIVTCEGDRYYGDPPWGIFGGHDGINATLRQERRTASEEHWPSKFTGLTLKAGSTIEITVPNSGGYGDPVERDPQLVARTSWTASRPSSRAERDYGVVIDPETLEVDVEATARTREERSAAIPA